MWDEDSFVVDLFRYDEHEETGILFFFHYPSLCSLDIIKEPSMFLVMKLTPIFLKYNVFFHYPILCSLNINEDPSIFLVMKLTSILYNIKKLALMQVYVKSCTKVICRIFL